MTVTFEGPGGLFTRLGKIIFAAKMLHEFAGGSGIDNLAAASASWISEIEDALDEIEGSTVSQQIKATGREVHSSLATFKSSVATMQLSLKTFAENLLIEQIDADNPLATRNALAAMQELRVQMAANAETIDSPAATITRSINAANDSTAPIVDNNEVGDVAMSVSNNRGADYPGIFAEDIVGTVTSDATSGAEQFTFKGEAIQANRRNPEWPKGSGASKVLTAKDAAIFSTSHNYLNNGDLEDFTAGAADNWLADSGAFGPDIVEETTTFYKGAKGIHLAGGNTTGIIKQTVPGLTGRQVMAVNLFYRVNVSPVAGEIFMELFDGTATIQNDSGDDLRITQSLTATTINTWFALTAVFEMPRNVPATVEFRLGESVSISAGTNCFIDHVCLADATQLYPGGPFAAVFSGANDWVIGDQITLTVANDRRAAFGSWLDAFFNTDANDILLPAAGVGSIAEGLIS